LKAVAVIGVDPRHAYAAEYLSRSWRVRLFPRPDDDRSGLGHGVSTPSTLGETLEGARACLGPIPQFGSEGEIAPGTTMTYRLEEESLRGMQPPRLIICGRANDYIRHLASKAPAKVVELMSRDDYATLNAIPTAEGVVARALEMSSRTLHGSRALVAGFGRCGLVLAHLMKGMGVSVVVAARRAESRAQAHALGMSAAPFDQLAEVLHECDFVINTVPAPVLTSGLLSKCRRKTIVLDIASAPGGTDFAACRRLGLRAELLPALPGKVAPLTAGEILGQVAEQILLEHERC